MATTWQFGTNDSQTVKKWSTAVVRDAEKMQFFAPLMYSIDGQDNKKQIRMEDAPKGQGVIRLHDDFKDKTGDRVTLYDIARIKGRGVHGDALLRDTGVDLNTYTMNLFYEDVATQVRTAGKLSEYRMALKFRQAARPQLARWAGRKVEEAIVLALWGLSTWNGSPFDNWSNTGESYTFLNPIQAFDSSHIVYAGNGYTTDTSVQADPSAVLNAQLLTKLETTALEDLDIPLEPLTIDGEDSFILLTSSRGAETLRYDPDFQRIVSTAAPRSYDNPLLKHSLGKYGMIHVVTYPKCLQPIANVNRSILLGNNALQMAKVEDWDWFEDFEDTRKRRKVISIGAMLGMAPTYFNGTRRNALAVDHYVRT